tara:strand:+ start:1195 stop:1491 length:297 start_codon:yes stop_codon:yes gene_type:complete
MDITQALLKLKPNAQWIVRGDTLEWLDTEQTEPTKAEIDAEIKRLQAEQDALAYQELRRSEYNKLNQDEMRFDDLINSTTTWVDSIKAIKAKYPKGSK